MQLVPWRQHRQTGSRQAMTLRDAVNQLFDESFWDPMRLFADTASLVPSASREFLPSFDVAETDKEIQVVADVPGYDPKHVKVSLDNGVLTIQGTMEEDKEEKNKKWYRREASRGSFLQQLSVPQGIDPSSVKCRLKNGKLTILLPKPADTASGGKALKIETE